MYPFYNACLTLYFLLTAPYYALHVILREHYRAGFGQRLGFVPREKSPSAHRVWFHGVSVGEIQMLIELGRRLGEAIPGLQSVYSTTTLTAQKLASKRLASQNAHLIYYPLDLPFAVRRALRRVNPSLVVVAETELWPNFLRECHRRQIPVVLVNGRISERSYRGYRLIRSLTRNFLPCIDLFLMQNEQYAKRILELGAPADRLRITGNMKADTQSPVNVASDELKQLFQRLRRSAGARILMAGSTHPGEEKILAQLYQQWKKKFPKLILVLAPRHLERVSHVGQELSALGIRFVRRSQYNGSDLEDAEVLLLDTLGELSSAYQWADIVFIGKSLLSRGGQNPLEAAMLGLPLIFGPHMENFSQETAALLQAGGAMQVENPAALDRAVVELLGDPQRLIDVGRRAKTASENLRGAMDRNCAILQEKITAQVFRDSHS